VPRTRELSYSQFKQFLYADKIEQVLIGDTLIRGKLKDAAVEQGQSAVFTSVRISAPDLVKELEKRQVNFSGQYESPFVKALVSWVLPALVFAGIWAFVFRRMGPGAGVMAFSKSRAKIYAETETGITFDDVAGQDEAKEELKEIIKRPALCLSTNSMPSARPGGLVA
jgi:cell division protease FtsH